jgi:hypothetical protein
MFYKYKMNIMFKYLILIKIDIWKLKKMRIYKMINKICKINKIIN